MTRKPASFAAAAWLAATLGACAQVPPSTPPDPGAGKGATMACDPASLSWTLGQAADDALVARAKAESGAKTVRILRPGMMITMEFSETRLNLRVDNAGKVLSYSCG